MQPLLTKIEDHPGRGEVEMNLGLATIIGNKLGLDWNKITAGSLMQGAFVEAEHKDLFPDKEMTVRNWIIACKIASDHLKESPTYYESLKKMEDTFDENWLRESIRKIVKKHLNEIHFPPKALDYNKLPDTDGFWH